jgi:hypothetical protein
MLALYQKKNSEVLKLHTNCDKMSISGLILSIINIKLKGFCGNEWLSFILEINLLN